MNIPGFDQHKAGDYKTAEKMYRDVLRETPDNADALHLLGLLLHQTGRSPAAIPLLQQAIECAPDSPQSVALLAMAMSLSNQDEQALEYCKQGLINDPDNAAIINAAGRIHQKLGDIRHAAHLFQRAAQIRPDLTDAQHNFGIALHQLGQFQQAAQQLQVAARTTPRNPYIHLNLALSLQRLGELENAREALRTSLTLKPDSLDAQQRLIYINLLLCDWHNLEQDVHKHLKLISAHVASQGKQEISPYVLNLLRVPKRSHHTVASYFASQIKDSVSSYHIEHTRDRVEGSNIRVGYVSPDLGAHAVGGLIYQMFRFHDRDKFDIYCYSERTFDDEYHREVKHGADVFRDISNQSFLSAARQIAADEIDILVNLGGYTQDTKPQIFALKPAPVQVSYLGYLNTMAADYMDYIIADRIVLPREHDKEFTESVVRLPGCFMVTSDLPTPSRTPTREELGLPSDKFVYASFNNPTKLEPEVYKAWMWILDQAPDTVLWLYSGGNPQTEANLLKEAEKYGIKENRICFAHNVPMGEHMARLRQADLMLDTFVYNAGATAVNALMSGVPIVTMPGETLLSRMGASFNHALSLNRLTCKNIEAYIQMCVYLGRNPDKLQPMRDHLKGTWMNNPFFDTAQFVRRLETAYETMWKRHTAGDPPGSFDVPEPEVF